METRSRLFKDFLGEKGFEEWGLNHNIEYHSNPESNN